MNLFSVADSARRSAGNSFPPIRVLHEPLRTHLGVLKVGDIELDGVLLTALEVAALLVLSALLLEEVDREFGRHVEVDCEVGARKSEDTVL